MANANFSDLYDHILPYLPGAETGVVDLHIRRVLREFYRRTTLWRETFNFVTTTAQSYLLTPAAGSVHSVFSVAVEGTPIGVLPENMQPTPAQVAAQTASTPTNWFTRYANQVSLNPKPTAGINITVEAIITLSLDNGIVVFPEDTYTQYCEQIAAGVIGEMMKMPGKPWTQDKAARDYSGMFVRTVIAVRAKLRDGGQPNASKLYGPTFGV